MKIYAKMMVIFHSSRENLVQELYLCPNISSRSPPNSLIIIYAQVFNTYVTSIEVYRHLQTEKLILFIFFQ